MKVRFTSAVMSQSSTAFDTLDRLVYLFQDGRHLWEINDPDEIENSYWIRSELNSRAGRRNVETLQKCVTASAYPSANKMHMLSIEVGISSTSASCLSPAEANRCLQAPVHVVVENAESDGAFLGAIIYALQRTDLSNAHTYEWWKIEHGGGYGELCKRVKDIQAATVGPCRIFVLADSDRETVDHITPTMTKVQNCCNELNVPYYILRKRKIENYLPLEALSTRRGRLYASFCTLTQEQRDYYEMKNGFRLNDSNGTVKIPSRQSTLYTNVPEFNLKNLCGGFSGNIWELFKTPQSYHITQQTLTQTCHGNLSELENLLDQIEALL